MREVKKCRAGRPCGGFAVLIGGLRYGSFRFAIFALFVVLVVGLDIDVAYAASNLANRYDGVVYGPSILAHGLSLDVDGERWWIVNAPDAFTAAVYAIGGNPDELTSDQKAYLSNSSTGGDFYTLSRAFEDIGGSFDLPDWMTDYEYRIYKQYESAYDGSTLYVGASRPSLQFRALAHYKVVLNGGNLGGGGSSGGGVVTDTYVYFKYNNETGVSLQQDFCGIAIPTSSYEDYLSWLDRLGDDYYLFIGISTGRAGNTSGNSYIEANWCHEMPTVSYSRDEGGSSPYPCVYSTASRTSFYVSGYYNASSNVIYDGGQYLLVDRDWSTTSTSVHVSSSTWGCRPLARYYWDGDSTGTGNPTVPDTNWPDEPTDDTPVQPVVPTHDPVSKPTYPTYNSFTLDLSFPSLVIQQGESYTADLQGILDAMEDHCQHLQSAISRGLAGYWNTQQTFLRQLYNASMTSIGDWVDWLEECASFEWDAYKRYLKQLFEWLADEIDYSISGGSYNDSTVVSWLKKIYYKLGDGKVSTKPVDPNANPDDLGDWISQLFANLFTALDDLAGGLLTSLATLLGGLVTKFPFSIPWDVAAILALLVADPVAPAVEFPVYTLSAGELVQVGTIDIDMDAWTPYLTGIHMMIRVSFILFLMLKTKDFMSIMEKAVGLDA